MKKLKLEDIQVESYETTEVPAENGTVEGNVNAKEVPTPPYTFCPFTCFNPTCVQTECFTECWSDCFTDVDLCCGAPA